METLRDSRGLAVSTASVTALDHIERATTALLASSGDVDTHIDEALRIDPHCVFAHCVRASTRLLGADCVRDAVLDETLATIERLIGHANDRERRHAAALVQWSKGHRRSALDGYGELLIDYPHDSLALCVTHALDFRFGQRELLRDRVAQVLPDWHAGIPHFGYVLAMYAFGLEETGDHTAAETVARQSLEITPDNAAAMHVIAHVLEMQGRTDDGIEFLESTRATWQANPGFAIHNAWHLALFWLDRDAIDHATGIYDQMLRPSRSSPTSALVDASALLWRLELRGVNVATRWRALARLWRRKPLRGGRSFNLVHATTAFVGAHQDRRARCIVGLLRSDSETRSANEADELALAIPFCEALLAFGRRDYGSAVERIGVVRMQAERCGGSIAQCDLIHLTFIEAALRSRSGHLAKVLAAERTARKPLSLLNQWLYARAVVSAY